MWEKISEYKLYNVLMKKIYILNVRYFMFVIKFFKIVVMGIFFCG